VGLVYISLAAPDGFVNKKFLFAAVDRATVKLRATQMALEILRRYLIKA
jgi:nicotinamide mononucleotide (NMN) deamidase PncC